MPTQKPRQWLSANLQRACRPSLTGLRVQGVSCHLTTVGNPLSNLSLMTRSGLGTADLGGGVRNTPRRHHQLRRRLLPDRCRGEHSVGYMRYIYTSGISLQPSCRALPLVSCA